MAGEQAIFISGGASGIGLAVAGYFADKGWRIGLADIDAAGLEAAKAGLPAGMATTYVMDVRDHGQWETALAGFAAASGGRIDVLFNNAGVAVGGEFAATPLSELQRCIDINLMGVVNGAHAGFPYLAKMPGSVMLITSSAAGIYGASGVAIYSATKFAVRGLAEALDGEWRPAGVKVRTLMPSFIETPLLDQPVQGSNRNVRESVIASGLEITPVAEVAEAAWNAVHGDRVHTQVGKTAKKLWFAARWMPGQIRKTAGKRLDRELRSRTS
ncbi:SDR family oxidoreductase [Sphingomonas sp. dw_22]|uniref:SDR family oxidoreductase n=1 Tax=Sphingomonas sp. dw_22 TaxID=2721175 RepID=UPI001BD39F28|nr:SDR family oxidoreductase [Sphingomonas sp. dw_22]